MGIFNLFGKPREKSVVVVEIRLPSPEKCAVCPDRDGCMLGDFIESLNTLSDNPPAETSDAA